ncbi:MAG TPA: ISL3 family transposase [Kiloniellales bacterium]|nr:ISL3 family transposase [Kiloniellales bacterium]
MRATSLFRRLIGVTSLFVTSVSFEPVGLVLQVRPRWRKPRCGKCCGPAPGYDHARPRRWRSLNLGVLKVWLEYRPRRVSCERCGRTRVEQVPWADHGSSFTRDFEELVAYLAQVTDKTTVTKLMGIAWTTVGNIVHRVVSTRLDPSRLDGLRRIGVDEFSYRKRHNYLTVVVDHDSGRVVWAAPGRSSETLAAFFGQLGPARLEELECVTIDMCQAYEKAIREHAPNAEIVFDRFHVQQLATKALDEVRREQLRTIRGTPEGRELFHSRFALLKNPWNLRPAERRKLREVERANAPLWRAYLLKEELARALDYRQLGRAEPALRQWLAWASRSRLKPFVRVARTIRKHFTGVLAYFQERLTNGVVEGINNHLRVIARRAFGFQCPQALISMLFLCRGGIELKPPLPR